MKVVVKVIERLILFLGFESASAGHKEKIIAACGGFLGILLTTTVSHWWLSAADAVYLSFSMGAAAVLLFAVPHSPLSQPWPFIGGNVISAIVGVAVYKLVPDVNIAAALALGIALLVMYYLRCLHPPGGATAILAVSGSDAVHQLGYYFVIAPILLNVLLLFSAAVMFNWFFPWRRYPAVFSRRENSSQANNGASISGLEQLSLTDLNYALRSSESFIDVTADDLRQLYRLAQQHRVSRHLTETQIRLGAYYCNSEGDIRRVIDESGPRQNYQEGIIYRTIAGKEKRGIGYCSRAEFARWAIAEVVSENGNWRQLESDGESN